VLLLLDYWPIERLKPASALRCLLEKIPLIALSATSSVVTYLVQRQGGAMEKFDHLAFPYRAANAALAYISYLAKTFWPSNLAPFYPHPGADVSWPRAAIAAIALVAMTALAVAWRRKHPYVLVGWLWFLGMLVPVIGLVQVGAQGMADRYTYLPLVGVFITVAWLTRTWTVQKPGRVPVVLAATAVLVVTLCVMTSLQIGRWRDGVTLYRHAVAVTPNNPVAQNLYGNALALRGRTREAVPHFETALRLEPDYPNAHFGLGIAKQQLGDLDGAVMHYKETVRLEPDQLRARYKLGEVLFLQRKYEDSEKAFQAVIDQEPRYMEAHNGLGMTLAARGRYREAMGKYIDALNIRNDYVDALLNLAVALVNTGQAERALKPLHEALQAAPDHAPTHMYLGLVRERLGDSEEARMHLQQALRLDPTLAPARAALERVETFP
jgi:Flp pilus assembly protein TadD